MQIYSCFNSPLAADPEYEDISPEYLYDIYRKGEIELICVLGPTACGKTRFAVNLAKQLSSLSSGAIKAEIISADSRQVYKKMDIGSGKDIEDYDGIAYHLIDIVEAGERYNLYQYQQDFEAAFTAVRLRGNIPILCGGTGLYIDAVCNAYHLSDNRYQAKKTFFIGVHLPREKVITAIDKRLEDRLKAGMVEEIQALIDSGVSVDSLLHYGLEYKFVTQYLIGELTYEQMKEKLSIAIHRFAKRQMTWFRGMERRGVKIHWLRSPMESR